MQLNPLAFTIQYASVHTAFKTLHANISLTTAQMYSISPAYAQLIQAKHIQCGSLPRTGILI